MTAALKTERLAVEHYGLLERFYRDQRSSMRVKAASQVWIARNPQLCAGLCLHQLAEGLWLTGLWVDQQQRQQGIASQLVQCCLSQQQQSVWLFCQPELEHFYQRLGFEACQQLPQPLQQRLSRYQRSKPSLIALANHRSSLGR